MINFIQDITGQTVFYMKYCSYDNPKMEKKSQKVAS